MTETSVCRWLTCEKQALPNGYLCGDHLVVVLKGEPKLPALTKALAAGVGTGLAAELIVRAFEEGAKLVIAVLGVGVAGDDSAGGLFSSPEQRLPSLLRYAEDDKEIEAQVIGTLQRFLRGTDA